VSWSSERAWHVFERASYGSLLASSSRLFAFRDRISLTALTWRNYCPRGVLSLARQANKGDKNRAGSKRVKEK